MKTIFDNIKDTFKSENYAEKQQILSPKVLNAGLNKMPGIYMIPIEKLKQSTCTIREIDENAEDIMQLSESIRIKGEGGRFSCSG